MSTEGRGWWAALQEGEPEPQRDDSGWDPAENLQCTGTWQEKEVWMAREDF